MTTFLRKKPLMILSVLVVLAFVLAGCAPAINKLIGVSKEAKSASEAAPLAQAVNASCVSEYLGGNDLKAAVQRALEDGQVQQLRAELEAQGFTFVPWAARALRVGQQLQVLLTFSPEAVIVYSPDGPTAFSLIPQGEQTSSRQPGKAKRALRPMKGIAKQQILDQLKQSPAFRELKRALEASGYKLDGRFRTVVDEQGKRLVVALRVAGLRSIHYHYTLTAQVQLAGKSLKVDSGSVKISASCGAPVEVPVAAAVEASAQPQPQVLDASYDGVTGWYDPSDKVTQTCTYIYGTTSCTTTNTANYPATLEAYNLGVRAGAYGMLAVDTLAVDKVMVLGGFGDVTLSQLEAFEAGQVSSEVSIQFADRARAESLLQSLTVDQIQSWLSRLAQAIIEGNFDAVYDQLLSDPSFQKFRDAVMYFLSPSQATTTNAKVAIRVMAGIRTGNGISATSPFPIGLLGPVFNAFHQLFISIGMSPAAALIAAASATYNFMVYWDGLKLKVAIDFGSSEAAKFELDLIVLVGYILLSKPHPIAGMLLTKLMKQMALTVLNPLLSTHFIKTFVNVAANVIRNYPQLTIVDIFMEITDKQGRTFTVPLYLRGPVGSIQDAKIYLTFQPGDALQRYPGVLFQWLEAAVQNLVGCSCGIIGMHFYTSPGSDIQNFINGVRYLYWNTDIAIIITWYEGGQLKFTCIGLLCSRLSQQSQQDQACMQVGLPPGCGAQPSGSPSSNTSPPSTVGPGPPPPEENYCPYSPCII